MPTVRQINFSLSFHSGLVPVYPYKACNFRTINIVCVEIEHVKVCERIRNIGIVYLVIYYPFTRPDGRRSAAFINQLTIKLLVRLSILSTLISECSSHFSFILIPKRLIRNPDFVHSISVWIISVIVIPPNQMTRQFWVSFYMYACVMGRTVKSLIENNCLSRESRLKLNRQVTLACRYIGNGLCLAHFNIREIYIW